MSVDHPLHRAVADRIEADLPPGYEMLRDPACRGAQLLSLFVGERKSRETRMCCVDALVLAEGRVRAIIEIEESGFPPTKICGKVLQAGIATHYVHELSGPPVPYANNILFVQVLDSAKSLRPGTRKDRQARLIEEELRRLLPLGNVTDYQLHYASVAEDDIGLVELGPAVAAALAER